MKSGFLIYQIWKFTIRFSKMGAKEEGKQREELETTLKLRAFTVNVIDISKKSMIILRKKHASEAVVTSMKKAKNSLNFS